MARSLWIAGAYRDDKFGFLRALVSNLNEISPEHFKHCGTDNVGSGYHKRRQRHVGWVDRYYSMCLKLFGTGFMLNIVTVA